MPIINPSKDQSLGTNHLIINTDGGSRGNPGPAATGIVISDSDGKVIHAFGNYLGVATNNVAEYTAVIDALSWANSNYPIATLQFRLDSKLVVEQVMRRWKIKDPNLQKLNAAVQALRTNHQGSTTFSYVPRAQNSAADAQVNLCLDQAPGTKD